MIGILPMFNAACWNIRGLNASDKQREVKEFIKGNFLNLVCIVETHVKSDSVGNVASRVFNRWSWVSNTSLSPSGTRIMLAWDVSVLDVMLLEAHGQFLNCELKIRGVAQPIFCSFVYGANHGIYRKQLWSGLRKFKAILGSQPWIVMGDFNSMLFPHDALGGSSRRNSDMEDFFHCVEDVELFDVVYTGIQHTWCQKPKEEGGLRRKLDRVMANIEFTSSFDDARVKFLPRSISDHAPSVLSFKGGSSKRQVGFKFDNYLVEHPDFRSTVSEGLGNER